MLGLVDFASDYDKELQQFYDGLVEAGREDYSAADDTIDFSASLADEE